MVRVALLAMLASACGRLGFDADDPTIDGPGLDTAMLDATNLIDTPPGACEPFRDDFDDGLVAPIWTTFADAGSNVTESNGVAMITLPPDGLAYAGYGSTCDYDLRGRRASVEVVMRPTAAIGVEMLIAVFVARENQVGVVLSNDQLIAYQRINDVFQSNLTTPYDPVQHRFIGVREVDGTLHWETSTNGSSWISRVNRPAPLDFSRLSVQLSVGVYVEHPSPGAGSFDNFVGS